MVFSRQAHASLSSLQVSIGEHIGTSPLALSLLSITKIRCSSDGIAATIVWYSVVTCLGFRWDFANLPNYTVQLHPLFRTGVALHFSLRNLVAPSPPSQSSGARGDPVSSTSSMVNPSPNFSVFWPLMRSQVGPVEADTGAYGPPTQQFLCLTLHH